MPIAVRPGAGGTRCGTVLAHFTGQVAEAEHDDFLRNFSHHDVQNPETNHWLGAWMNMKSMQQDLTDREGYDDMLDKLLRSLPPERRLAGIPPEQRLAGMPPEQRLAGIPPEQRLAGIPLERRLAGIPPEQRLAGIPPEQRLAGIPLEQTLLAMPDEALRALSDDYIRGLPDAVQSAIRKRLGDSRHR